jgi:hypothetical protein
MSRRVCWVNNRKQDFNLFNALQRTIMERLVCVAEQLRQKPNKSDQHGKPCKSCQPNKCAACTTAATATGRTATTGRSTATGSCATGSRTANINNAGINAKCACCNNNTRHNHANNNTINPSSGRQNISSGLWDCVKFGNFKQANASSANSVERCFAIPAGVTV